MRLNGLRWGWLWAVAVALLLTAGCSSKEVDPDELPAELVKFEPSLRIKTLWSSSVGDGSERLRLGLRPSTDGKRLYAAAHGGRVAAYDLKKGKRVWSAKTGLSLSAGPATDGELVVAGSNNGEIVALEADTGEERWQVEVTSEVLGAPAVGGDKVLVQTVNGKLTALNAETGDVEWAIQQSMPALSVRGTSSPVITRGRVVSGFDNGRVASYNLDDGGVLWNVLMDPPSGRTELDRLIDVDASPVVAGSDVYAAAYQGRVGAIDLESGRLLWSRELSVYSSFSVDVGGIYAADQRSELVALSRGSGRELSRRKDLRNRDISGPAILANSVVVGDFEGYVHWFDLETGELQARVKAGGDRITSQPLVHDGVAYVVNDAGSVYALSIRADK